MNVRRLLPKWVKRPLRFILTSIAFFPYRGKGRHCPVCGKDSRVFGVFGIDRRVDAKCMWCGALERHRLVRLFFMKRTNLFDGTPKRMLHFGPEPFFINGFRRALGEGYLSADLFNTDAMVSMDITDIRFPDDSFDVVYCSHVLEHVPDDRKAMRELHRVLHPDGWAVILVPMSGGEKTIEDPSISDPKIRLALFHQEDHVRLYGTDYIDRLREAGFRVAVTTPSEFLSPGEIIEHGITPAAGDIYFCRKQDGQPEHPT